MPFVDPAWKRLRHPGRAGDTGWMCDIGLVAAKYGRSISELPYSLRIVIENLARHRLLDPSGPVGERDIAACVAFEDHAGIGVPLQVERVILPDSSGLPVLLDLASLRDAVRRAGGDPARVNPLVAVDLIVDHSLQVDHAGRPDAVALNLTRELERNGERYRFLKWAEQAFDTLRVFPPGTGIIHQVNLEHIAPVVMTRKIEGEQVIHPDFVIGGDSHTPMINGIGVLGWGAGGIDAEAALLGHPYIVPVPEIVGVRLTGEVPAGVMTTDMALLLTQRLRREGVTGAFVEYFGPGIERLSVPERATIANMAPEYGATIGFFPIDAATISFIERSRGREQARLVEAYTKANHLFRESDSAVPRFSRVIEIDLGEASLSIAGPKRPQDRIALTDVANDFHMRLARPLADDGFAAQPPKANSASTLAHGAIVIAAITSCTNTSNPSVMLAAGLLARKAVQLGLKPPPHVKTSLAPGSRVVTRYLEDAGLMKDLDSLGFNVIGYGCTTCGGKSGPLDPSVADAISRDGIVAAAVLSGNRNFEGRIHRLVRANYIMSPPLVVAYALAGSIEIDLQTQPLGHSPSHGDIYLKDIWPSAEDIAALIPATMRPDLYAEIYGGDNTRMPLWDEMKAPRGVCFPWEPSSLYLVEPPFFRLDDASRTTDQDLSGARVLALFGDSLTTDHISPGGEIPVDSPAGQYLVEHGVAQKDFNSYVGRRCNHEVMVRGTFGNIRIKNLLVPEREGGFTIDRATGEECSVFDAASRYMSRGTPTIILAGKEYGTGSSRDWAAKGSALLGVRAVLAESYERIHRSNLIGMGILPLRFRAGESWQSLGLDGTEVFDFDGIDAAVKSGEPIRVRAKRADQQRDFNVVVDSLTESERRILLAGGIQQAVLHHFLGDAPPPSPTSADRNGASVAR